ncbi:LysR family transcriptional regulator [Sinorhizobium meliloti CCBAU 01290]|nr:LysR family transcriptional regulator [Sinorhizobium meliloti CCBAU 01290]
MELRHLRYFVAVADAASFTAAARGLNISQPPLSQQIRDLEAEIGTRLFERSSRNVELTEAGANFLEHARMILGQVEHATHQARAIGSGQVGTLNIATTGSVLLGPLSNLIARFRDAWPGVFVRIHEMDPEAQEAALLSHRTDLSFVRRPQNNPDLVTHVAWHEKVAWPCPSTIAWRVQRRSSSVSPKGKLRLPGLADSRFARYLHDCCVAAGFVPDITNEVVESYSLTSLVAAGLGVALVPQCIRTLSRPGVVYRPLADPAPEADVYVISRPNPGPVIAAFLEAAQRLAGIHD